MKNSSSAADGHRARAHRAAGVLLCLTLALAAMLSASAHAYPVSGAQRLARAQAHHPASRGALAAASAHNGPSGKSHGHGRSTQHRHTHRSHHSATHSHATHHTAAGGSPGASPTDPPASAPARCEDGSVPTLAEEGQFGCRDGSEPACQEGFQPVLAHGGAKLVCDAEAQEEPIEEEALEEEPEDEEGE